MRYWINYLDKVEEKLGKKIQVYGHSLTRGHGTRVTVTPASAAIGWVAERPNDMQAGDFEVSSLGQFLPSREKPTDMKPGDYNHFVRPAFVLATKDASKEPLLLEPKPGPSANPLCIFTVKKIELRGKEILIL